MTVTVDLTNDYQYVDGVETVTFTANRSGETQTATLNFAKRFNVDRSLAKALGMVGIQGDEIAWYLAGNELANNGQTGPITDVQVGDKLTDAAGNIFVVFQNGIHYVAITNMWWVGTRLQ